MDFACFKRDLETERSLTVHSLHQSMNPVEREFLERELSLLDAQLGWVEDLMFRKIA